MRSVFIALLLLIIGADPAMSNNRIAGSTPVWR